MLLGQSKMKIVEENRSLSNSGDHSRQVEKNVEWKTVEVKGR